jgi:glycopeptide antibiotics resistance protein
MDLLGHDSPMPASRHIVRVVKILMLNTWTESPTTNEMIFKVFNINTVVDKGNSDGFFDTFGNILALVVPLGIEKQFAEVFHALNPFMLGGIFCLFLSSGSVHLRWSLTHI